MLGALWQFNIANWKITKGVVAKFNLLSWVKKHSCVSFLAGKSPLNFHVSSFNLVKPSVFDDEFTIFVGYPLVN
jgi:hypothetical protein